MKRSYEIFVSINLIVGTAKSVKRFATEIFLARPDRLPGPHSLLYEGYRVNVPGASGRGVVLTIHLLLAPRLKKE
jgi:hypothetical protein